MIGSLVVELVSVERSTPFGVYTSGAKNDSLGSGNRQSASMESAEIPRNSRLYFARNAHNNNIANIARAASHLNDIELTRGYRRRMPNGCNARRCTI